MKASARLFNLLTVLVLGMTLMVCLCAGVTFAYPQAPFNPFKPQDNTVPALLPPVPTEVPFATLVTYPTLPPVWTSTASAPSTEVPTSLTATALPATSTSASSGPTATRTPFPTPVGPTVTQSPTELPSRTPTPKAPAATATGRSYPGPATDTPQAAVATDTPNATGYP